MNFWEIVDSEREYKNISRKELAYLADFSVNSIPTGIARGSIPAADVAYRIAKVLDVTVEYLLLGGNVQSQQKINENNKNLEIIERSKKYTKNHELIDNFEKLPNNLQKSVEDLVQNITSYIQN
ncbi:MAG: helix-turn-helix transcriptional regulator [Treponema sp.]|nr:helix-turn-helix transcriptional regulator [Treponema sp.]